MAPLFSCEFCEILNSKFFTKQLQVIPYMRIIFWDPVNHIIWWNILRKMLENKLFLHKNLITDAWQGPSPKYACICHIPKNIFPEKICNSQ